MKILYLMVLSVLVMSCIAFQLKFPGVKIPIDTIKQAQRAHKYLGEQLSLYRHNKMSKYNLYLAVQNYQEILDQIKVIVLSQIINFVIGGRNIVLGKGNVVLGSNNKLAGYNNWILTERQITSSSIETNVLYFQKWRIKLDNIDYIQYRPEYAIQNMSNEDNQFLTKSRSIRDIRNFRGRKNRKRKLGRFF